MTTLLEQEIMTRLSKLDEGQQRRVLEFITTLETPEPRFYYTAQELLRLPADERERMVAEAFGVAVDEG